MYLLNTIWKVVIVAINMKRINKSINKEKLKENWSSCKLKITTSLT